MNAFLHISLLLSLMLITPPSNPLTFRISRFSSSPSSPVVLEGDAQASVGELELNSVNYLCRVGHVIYKRTIPLYDKFSHKNADFTTHFTFTLDTQNRSRSLSYRINLREVLPPFVTVGITAATGPYVERHTLQSWEFSSTSLDIVDEEKDREVNSRIGLVTGLSLSGFVVIICVCLIAICESSSGKKVEIEVKTDEDNKINYSDDTDNLRSISDHLDRTWPRRFSYQELSSATQEFSDENKLGEGGFGGVYKGRLFSWDLTVAVKRFSSASKQGKKEYITEVKTISMVRHRNLVQLIGWCHERGEFLLVYEFMPNGSLDYHLFGKKHKLLEWGSRYRIAVGLASALLYLHEEWEQCVLHRDIKSSNIMLDSEFNVKLGDFGLARLMAHGLGHQTTGLAGTLGYLAPEYVSTGRASKESDVYSFGIVLLEIVTGKKSVRTLGRGKSLLEWVWDFYGEEGIISAVDEKLGMNLNAEQAERLVTVGLWCAHPDRTLRPSIRQAVRALNFEADLPRLPNRMPVAVYCETPSHSISSGEALITVTSLESGR
ncbi:L-type lectin-domain containing receptor kinase IX.1 [Striga hermonthica]|uniref:L-type lectin-domain containing receptor kinase IX.1 n=1 Tax=Striga hermonthica TaxID=68872 RepID=A0A9N7NQW9_STRHE|nr:L-type lectin-domain containing receptor kinase IX.1 [Striga hermonthica]